MCPAGIEDAAAEAAGLQGGGRRLGFCFPWVVVHCHWCLCDVAPSVEQQKCCASFPRWCFQEAGSPCDSSQLWGSGLVAYQQQCWWCPQAVHHEHITRWVGPFAIRRASVSCMNFLLGILLFTWHSEKLMVPLVTRYWWSSRARAKAGSCDLGAGLWKHLLVVMCVNRDSHRELSNLI